MPVNLSPKVMSTLRPITTTLEHIMRSPPNIYASTHGKKSFTYINHFTPMSEKMLTHYTSHSFNFSQSRYVRIKE